MEWERQRTYDREAGREEGRAEGRAETIVALLENGVKIEVIAQSMKMSVEEVKKITSQYEKQTQV